MTVRKAIEQNEWNKFLQEFSKRNRGRRARFQFFTPTSVLEEGEEGHLRSVRLAIKGENAPRLVFKRSDETGVTAKDVLGEVPQVSRLSVQYDTDGSEDALEIEDAQGMLVMLRMESKVDGAS